MAQKKKSLKENDLFDKAIKSESGGGKYRDNRKNKSDKPSVGSLQYVEDTAMSFLNSNPEYKPKFKGMKFNSDKFFNTWNSLEDKDKDFLDKTKSYLKSSNLDPVLKKHKIADEDLQSYFSLATQLGPNLLNKAIDRAGSTNINAVTGHLMENANKYFKSYVDNGGDIKPIIDRFASMQKIVDRGEMVDNLVMEPMPMSFQNQVMSDVFNYKVTKIPEAPNTIEDASKVNRKVNGKFDTISTQQSAQESLNKVNKFVKNKQGDFGGADPFQPSGFIERGASAVIDFAVATPSYLYDKASRIPDIEREDFKELGDSFVDHLTESGAIGLLTQRAIQGVITSGAVDPNYDPKKDDMYDYFTEGLDNEDLKSLIEDYSYNQKDFRTTATLMKARNKRLKEMEAYKEENPVLNGVAFMGSMLMDTAVMLPVTNAIALQGAATLTNAGLTSIKSAKKLGWLIASETVEQGAQDLVWSKYQKDYEFSPAIFMAGVGLGVGMRGAADAFSNNRIIKDITNNEDGFIRLSKEQAKELISQVAKETDDIQAVQLAKNLSDVKIARANELRKQLVQDYDILQVGIENTKKNMKYVGQELGKSHPEFKKLKGELQKLTRRSNTYEKSFQVQMAQLVDGSHPSLKTALNPDFNIKKMSKELGIDYKLVDTPDKIRNFLGLKHGDFAEGIIVDGEKGYEQILTKQLRELDVNKRVNANQFLQSVSDTMKTSPLDIKEGLTKAQLVGNWVGTKLEINPDGLVSRYLLNKGNLVNSENAHVRGFYNWLAPDSAGRTGASKIRAGETKTIYRNRYHGALMTNYRDQGNELLKHFHKSKHKNMINRAFNFEELENKVVPIFRDRLELTDTAFKAKYPDVRVQEISDKFVKDYNKLNNMVIEDANRHGVIGVGKKSSDNFIHRAWDSNEARLYSKEDLSDAIYEGMRKKLLEEGLPFEESFLRKQANDFTFGLQSKDITNNIEATSTYVENLNKFLKSAEGQSSDEVIKATEAAITKANAQKAANELAELGRRADIDITVEIPNSGGKKLSDIMEKNFMSTQDRYNSRMAARTAAAEHGIKDIKVLDSWRADAILAEKKRLIKEGGDHIQENVDYLDKVLKQDIKSFQYGGLGGQGDVIEVEANDYLRLAKKLSVANLMGKVGIASIAEYGGTVSEIGLYNAGKSYFDAIGHIYRRSDLLGLKSVNRVADITDDMAALTGIGMGDMTFTSRGMSQAEKIFKKGTMSGIERGIDAAGAVTQGTFGWVETAGRRATSNGLAIKWGRHFQNGDPEGFIGKLFNKKITNRTFENVGLGDWVEEGGERVFKTNKLYDKIKKNYLKHSVNPDNTITRMNFDKWDPDARDAFRNTIKLQTSHIYADPDSTTSALWETTGVGRILKQFQTFSRNSQSKIAAYTYNNMLHGFKESGLMNDEVTIGLNKMFWAGVMGTLAVGLRDELKSTGTGTGLFNELLEVTDTPMQSLIIGFGRSSMIGGLDTVYGISMGLVGADNIFNRSSFTGRDKNFFNLAASPIGQLGVGVYNLPNTLINEGAAETGWDVLKLTPLQRTIGIQQLINFMNEK